MWSVKFPLPNMKTSLLLIRNFEAKPGRPFLQSKKKGSSASEGSQRPSGYWLRISFLIRIPLVITWQEPDRSMTNTRLPGIIAATNPKKPSGSSPGFWQHFLAPVRDTCSIRGSQDMLIWHRLFLFRHCWLHWVVSYLPALESPVCYLSSVIRKN